MRKPRIREWILMMLVIGITSLSLLNRRVSQISTEFSEEGIDVMRSKIIDHKKFGGNHELGVMVDEIFDNVPKKAPILPPVNEEETEVEEEEQEIPNQEEDDPKDEENEEEEEMQGTIKAREQSKEIRALIAKKRDEALAKERQKPYIDTCDGYFTINRDYNQHPIINSRAAGDPIVCDVPCTRLSIPNGNIVDVASRTECPHTKDISLTMENTGVPNGDNNLIAGNTKLYSDVPMQYFSWAEYDFMRPPKPKTGGAMMAVLISNCGPQYRLNYLRELMNYGVTVHSYGVCMKNQDGMRVPDKMRIIEEYKFTFAFENSETDDYVTEKLFGPLAAGSVPVYYGAPNAKNFQPSDHSVIHARDFSSAKELAEHLIMLDKNDAAYNAYLEWKEEGPSKDFVALVDLAIVHSECRVCIRSGDIDRSLIGEVVTGPFEKENQLEAKKYEGSVALMLKIRPRGKFWLKRIYLQELTTNELTKLIKSKYPSKGNVYSVYRLWDYMHTPITTNEQLRELAYGDELEVIFEDPLSTERHGYSSWVMKRQRRYVVE